MECPKCNTPVKGRFCSKCGSKAVSASAAAAPAASAAVEEQDGTTSGAAAAVGNCECGATADAINANGFCDDCGQRRLPRPEDHNEIVIHSRLASVTDRGIKHAENQDWHALAEISFEGQPVQILVVCDGVSSSSGGAPAAQAASKAACAVAARNISHKMKPQDAIVLAIRAAQKDVCALSWTPQPRPPDQEDQPPTCTIVVAVVMKGKLYWGWLGDSRLYWASLKSANSFGSLIKDHSWINAEVDAGRPLDEVVAEAKREKYTRAIVRSLGSAEGPAESLMPDLGEMDLPKDCIVLNCSDGLHVYLDASSDMAREIRNSGHLDALSLARKLVEYANSRGGVDNITAAVYRS